MSDYPSWPAALRLSEHVQFTTIDDTMVLIDFRSGRYLGLNEIGSRVLSCIHQRGELNDLVAGLVDEFEVSEDQLRNDIRQLVNQLLERRLIEADPR